VVHPLFLSDLSVGVPSADATPASTEAFEVFFALIQGDSSPETIPHTIDPRDQRAPSASKGPPLRPSSASAPSIWLAVPALPRRSLTS
jgi:hypothetical protein